MQEAFTICTDAVNECFQVYNLLDAKYNLTQTAFILFFLFSVHRFIIKPILGGNVGSDRARRPKEDSDEKES